MLLPPYPPRGYPDEGWPLPEGVRLIENVPVTEHDGVPLHADVLEPPAPNGATIVWVHGGGWRWCDRRTAFERLFRFTERGWTGVTLDYRLTDVARFPAPVRDVQAGLRWVAEEVGRRGLDPDRVVGFGGSAGAHLLLLSVLGAQDAEIGDPAGETLAALTPILAAKGGDALKTTAAARQAARNWSSAIMWMRLRSNCVAIL